MTEPKPGCIHPDSACGNDLLKLGLLAVLACIGLSAIPHRIAHNRRPR